MRQKKYRIRKRFNRKTLILYAMMLPGFIYIFINNYMPLPGLAIAFKRFDYSKGIWDSAWAGLSNFTYLFRTQDALNMVRNTLGYNLIFIILGNVLAVAVAIMLNFLRGKLNQKNIPDADPDSLSLINRRCILYRVCILRTGKRILKQFSCSDGAG